VGRGTTIELVSPASTGSAFYGLLTKYRNTPYHLCFETDDFNAETERLSREGFVKTGEPQVALQLEIRALLEKLGTKYPQTVVV